MNMNTNLTTLWSNPHLRYCAIGLAVIEIVAVWLPAYKPQLDETKSVVLLYALAAASNSTPTTPTKTP